MHGILIVDKPQGFTSFDVVAKLRGICKTRKIGHGGTLDPMATGVLPVFIGNAAKGVDLQPNSDKCYDAVMLLGKCTDTGDITGTVLKESAVPASIDEAAVRAVLGQFLGEGMQVPPMYSAVKINGQPLYKAARKGETVERKARPIVIHSLSLTERVSALEYRLQIHCGKGTYVRVLLEDIGRALGVPATMSALRRTMASGYPLEQAYSFEQIQAAKDEGRLETLLLGIETVFAALDAVSVTAAQKQRLLNGAPVSRVNAQPGECRIYCEDEFLGIGVVADGSLRQKKLFCERPANKSQVEISDF